MGAQKQNKRNRQGVITGNYFAYYEWQPDDAGGFVIKRLFPIRDAIIDPNAHNIADAKYVGRRFFTSKKERLENTLSNF